MDVADTLLEKIFSWLNLQKKYSDKFNDMAEELEKGKKISNVTKVVGSSVSVGGAVALTAAGVLGFFTGGLAVIPVLVVTGSIATAAGVTTNVTSDVIEIIASNSTMKDAEETAETIENLEKGIQKLMETLKKEGERREQRAGSIPPEDYVVERILRAMAKRCGLVLHEDISLLNMMSGLSTYVLSGEDIGLNILGSGVKVLSKFVLKAVAKQSGKALVRELFPELVSSVGRVATKAAGRVAGGAVGLVFSVSELVINCKNLDDCETEASKSLSASAEAIRSASKELEKELDLIEKALKRLAGVKSCVENTERRSSSQRKTLIDFAVLNCRDEATVQWLRENSESEVFFKLVDMFSLLKKKIDEEEKRNHSNDVDITFVAHGSITDPMIPAGRLLPLPTVSDVVLYSPWNCNLSVDAAYGVATGRMKPEDRVFYCCGGNCKTPDEEHHPKNLPNRWNSLKKAGDQMIPNILLHPVGTPGDGAWKHFEILTNKYGKAGRNHIIVPFILPGEKNSASSHNVPFFIVTLALSLVLLFSRFQATFHLTACLGKNSSRQKLDKEHLKKQYAYTIDKTAMSSSSSALARALFRALARGDLDDVKLIHILKCVFGSI